MIIGSDVRSVNRKWEGNLEAAGVDAALLNDWEEAGGGNCPVISPASWWMSIRAQTN